MVRYDYDNAMSVLDYMRKHSIINEEVSLACNKIAGAYACNERSMCDDQDFIIMNKFATEHKIILF